jgi:integrase/recombinase XerD
MRIQKKQFPVLPPQFNNLRVTLDSIQSYLKGYESTYPYRDPFTQSALSPAGIHKISVNVMRAEMDLKRFVTWCATEQLNLAPEHFRPNHISHFVQFLRVDCKLGPITLARSTTFLRCFFRSYIRMHNFRIQNPVVPNLIKIPNKINARSISEKEMESLIQRIDRTTPWSRQLQLVVRMTYDGAARIGEVLNLRLEDLRLNKGEKAIASFHVVRKGGKVRELYMAEGTEKLLLAHLHENSITGPLQPVFPSQKSADRPMCQHILRRLIQKHLKALGIRRKIYGTHIMRHSAAKHMIARNADPYVVADYLSHSSIGTTIGNYASPTNVEVAKAFRKAMPKYDYRRVRKALQFFEASGVSGSI